MDADNPEQQQKKQSTALRKTAVAKRPTRHAPKQDIYIAALGSSAGGLEASEQFYRNLPANTGIGFVMIPHLAPEHKGLLTELLQHYTEMKVMQAVDGTKVLPNCVYVIPPNKYMTIMHGTLQLLDITTPHGVRMPIDFFLRHLADDQGDKAIGIILSGMGTDGSLGIQAIKENFGMTMVQDTQSAKFEGMPRSAADTGLIDYVLPAESMPAALVDYVNRSGHLTQHKDAREQTASNALQKIYSLLRAHTGNDFSFYKSNTVMRRIERRMGIHQLDNITHYVRYLQDNPQELDLLFKEFLIGVTSFFRDPEAFESLCKNAIPELLLRKAKNDLFRVWVPGCSTGQEAYSIAILLRECLDTLRLVGQVKIQIFATDIDETTIETARQGLFPANIVADVTPKRLKRFFTEDGSNYRINKEVRETVVFAPQNLLRDPPFTRLDLLSCRNLLIYLTPETQQKLFPLFHYALNADGILFLGSSETISNNSDLFEVLDAPNKTFRRKSFSAAVGGLVDITTTPIPYGSLKPRVPVPIPQDGGTALPELTNRLFLESFAPPAVLVTENGDIVCISGRTGKYLELPAGKANMNLFAMAREGLRLELGSALHQAVKQRTKVVQKGIKVTTDGAYQMIDLSVMPIMEPEALRGLLMVVFQAVDSVELPEPARRPGSRAAGVSSVRVAELEKELKLKKEQLQAINDQMSALNEETQSANEELQSANEELQSTNEEVMTSREEMQSLNEELMTVNAELRTKNEELSHSTDDMKNLLNGTEIATIFLDSHLHIKRFTPSITQVFNLIPSDNGRSIGDISLNLMYENLVPDAHKVLETLAAKDLQVTSKDKRWFQMRIMPYRTIANVIDGVVITFMDITQLKELESTLIEREARLQDAEEYASSIIATLHEPFLVLDAEMQITSASLAFCELFKTTQKETEKRSLYTLGNGQWDIPELKVLLEEVLPEKTQFQDFRIEHDFPTIGHKVLTLNARQLHHDKKKRTAPMILLAIEDLTSGSHASADKSYESNKTD